MPSNADARDKGYADGGRVKKPDSNAPGLSNLLAEI